MSLAHLSDSDAVVKAIAEYDELGRDAFLSKYGFGAARRYVLVYEGRDYDSKAIVGAAHGYQFPLEGPLSNSEFVGGVQGAAQKLLDLGFDIKDLQETGEIKTPIREAFEEILDDYVRARMRDAFSGDHVLKQTVDALRDALQSLPSVASRSSIVVKASLGTGNWAKVPWVALMDSRETDSTRHGVYCVYLFRQDMTGVYLTLNQGVTEPRQRSGRRGGRQFLKATAEAVRHQTTDLLRDLFHLDDKIDLRADAGLGREYEESTIAYKLYETGDVPEDRRLEEDLSVVLGAYDRYLADRPAVAVSTPAPSIDIAGVVSDFATALEESHVFFGSRHESLVRSFVVSLATKGFVILTGLSGSGKTQLALRFGDWLGSNKCQLIPVRPDWTGAESVFGFEDALQPPTDDGRRVWHVPQALEFILRAAADPQSPFLLILDEMNLAHVERYFADVLSGMESGHPVLPNLRREDDGRWRAVPAADQRLPFPTNLLVVGTVNVDESTYMFSPKVLDRANVFEFRVDSADLSTEFRRPTACRPGDPSLVTAFLRVTLDDQWHLTHPAGNLSEFAEHLQAVHRLLARDGWEFGYRVFYEGVRFASIFALSGASDATSALDHQIAQKVLPRLHGSRRRLEPTIRSLARYTYDFSDDTLSAADFDVVGSHADPPRLPLSYDKLRRMMQSLVANQFASFTE